MKCQSDTYSLIKHKKKEYNYNKLIDKKSKR